ncbi:MAG: hypothetical protein IPN76_13445 [Saprospiraceae bacterium]|nr:hypothetical protein [Saprospiraceae bacterium]
MQQGELTGHRREAFADGELLVYPNPAKEFLQVFIKDQSRANGDGMEHRQRLRANRAAWFQ